MKPTDEIKCEAGNQCTSDVFCMILDRDNDLVGYYCEHHSDIALAELGSADYRIEEI